MRIFVVVVLFGLVSIAPALAGPDTCERYCNCTDLGVPNLSPNPSCQSMAGEADGPGGADVSQCGSAEKGGCLCVTVPNAAPVCDGRACLGNPCS